VVILGFALQPNVAFICGCTLPVYVRSNMTQSDFKASAEDRSRFYWWLAEWFMKPPGSDEIASLAGMALPAVDAQADALGAALRTLRDVAQTLSGKNSLDSLGAEYTRLMSGIQEGYGPPPPFESVWRENRLIGESTAAVINIYAQAGFADIDPEAGPQDHIGVELKFLALLALRESEAWVAGSEDIAQTRAAQQEAFLNQHLAAWAPRWADAIIQQSHEPLFTTLAALLKASLEQTHEELATSLKLGKKASDLNLKREDIAHAGADGNI